jgi:hypothetical protein
LNRAGATKRAVAAVLAVPAHRRQLSLKKRWSLAIISFKKIRRNHRLRFPQEIGNPGQDFWRLLVTGHYFL